MRTRARGCQEAKDRSRGRHRDSGRKGVRAYTRRRLLSRPPNGPYRSAPPPRGAASPTRRRCPRPRARRACAVARRRSPSRWAPACRRRTWPPGTTSRPCGQTPADGRAWAFVLRVCVCECVCTGTRVCVYACVCVCVCATRKVLAHSTGGVGAHTHAPQHTHTHTSAHTLTLSHAYTRTL